MNECWIYKKSLNLKKFAKMFLLDMEGGQDGGLFYEQGKKIKDVNFSGKIIAN